MEWGGGSGRNWIMDWRHVIPDPHTVSCNYTNKGPYLEYTIVSGGSIIASVADPTTANSTIITETHTINYVQTNILGCIEIEDYSLLCKINIFSILYNTLLYILNKLSDN